MTSDLIPSSNHVRNQSSASGVAVEFLEKFRPSGPWVLTAIKPDGPIETITANGADDVRGFVERNNGVRNLYFSVNPTRTTMFSKAAKVDISAIAFVLSDLDPRADERQRRPRLGTSPLLRVSHRRPPPSSTAATACKHSGDWLNPSNCQNRTSLRMIRVSSSGSIHQRRRRSSTTPKVASKP
jgi:hypothetical protein